MTTTLTAAGSAEVPGLPEELLYRLTVEQYEAMLSAGILTADAKCELIDGILIRKMTKNPPHVVACALLMNELIAAAPRGFQLLMEAPTAAERSRPEPDAALQRGTPRDYLIRRPEPADVPLIVEVSDSTLAFDRGHKRALYARSGYPVYWIVNLVERQVEVYWDPTGDVELPIYRASMVYQPAESVPLVLDGVEIMEIPVSDLLP